MRRPPATSSRRPCHPGGCHGANDQVDSSTLVTVHFNPASLQLTVSNELKDTRNNERKQYIAKSSSKLTMDLLFDTTETGEDVMRTTRKLQAFLVPATPPGQQAPREVPPPLVMFEWGTLRFKGVAESYKETIDFFSPDGVPLRSSVNLTLSRQDKVFDDSPGGSGAASNPANDSLSLPGSNSPAQTAAGAGAPGAARGIAASNGEESLRFSAGGGLTVSGGVQLKAAAAFSVSAGIDGSAGAGLSLGGAASGGLSLGATAGASAGLSLGASGGISASAGAGIAVGGPAGLSARAGLSATEGAFSGLGPRAGASPSIDTDRLRTNLPGAKLSVDSGAAFSIGGSTSSDSPAGLRTNVGTTENLKLKLTFDP